MTSTTLFSHTILFFLVLSLSLSLPLTANRQISAEVFTCDSSNALLNSVCQVTLSRINEELSGAGIGIDRNGILFTYTDDKDRKIDTGHSCSVTAQIRKQTAEARISSSSRLDLVVKKITEPFALRLQLPVSVSAQVDVKQRFGFRFFGSCSNTGSDSYSLKASASTTADAVLGINLSPSFGQLNSGDYALILEPQVVVLSSLRNLDLNFRVSGVSPLSSVLTFVHGFSSTVLKSITAIFTGESVSRIIRDAIPFDIGAPIILGVGALPGFIEQAIWGRLLDFVGHKIEKKAMGFGPDLEDDLQRKLNRALKVDSNGKRVIVIKQNIVELLQAGDANVFASIGTDPSVACFASASRMCSFGSPRRGIPRGCIPAQQRCAQLRTEFSKKTNPTKLINAKPLVARTMPTSTRPPETKIRRTTRLFSPCFENRGRSPGRSLCP